MKLRALADKDINGIYEWMKDPEVNCFFRFDPNTITKESIHSFVSNSFTNENRHYAIVNEDDEYLGTISLKNINYADRNAEYAISIRKNSIGTGIAFFATKELFKEAFDVLELNKIYLNVLSDNVRAIKFYNKMGFIYEGEFKKHIKIKGEFRDISWYGIFREQYLDNKNNQ